jgi:hypothetical protein
MLPGMARRLNVMMRQRTIKTCLSCVKVNPWQVLNGSGFNVLSGPDGLRPGEDLSTRKQLLQNIRRLYPIDNRDIFSLLYVFLLEELKIENCIFVSCLGLDSSRHFL